MPRILSVLAGFTALAISAPIAAQDNLITFGVFVNIPTVNTPDFEDAAREHAQWHADQNDTQAWPAYQALTGRAVEYVFLAPGMQWSGFDNPSVDIMADQAHWAQSGARYAESEEVIIWADVPNSGNPPADPTAFPIVQVFEFEVNPGGEPSVLRAIERFKTAIDASGSELRYGWSRVVSADGPPSYFIAIWAPDFATLGTPGPTPIEVLSSAFGPAEAGDVVATFERGTTSTASQIWTLRPDLSYFPN